MEVYGRKWNWRAFVMRQKDHARNFCAFGFVGLFITTCAIIIDKYLPIIYNFFIQ